MLREARNTAGEGLALPDPVPLNYVTDLSLISHELGWRPEVSLNDGLKTLF